MGGGGGGGALGWLINPVAAANALAISKANEAAQKKIKEEGETRQTQNDSLLQEMEDKKAGEPADQSAAVTEAKKKQKAKTSSAQGRKSTILTSPLGIQGGETGGSKTLLGQ